jgi:MFS family permease
MTELWQLNLFWGVLSGVGTGIVAPVLGATVANRWFVERRGLVLGIFGAAASGWPAHLRAGAHVARRSRRLA